MEHAGAMCALRFTVGRVLIFCFGGGFAATRNIQNPPTHPHSSTKSLDPPTPPLWLAGPGSRWPHPPRYGPQTTASHKAETATMHTLAFSTQA